MPDILATSELQTIRYVAYSAIATCTLDLVICTLEHQSLSKLLKLLKLSKLLKLVKLLEPLKPLKLKSFKGFKSLKRFKSCKIFGSL